VIFRNHMVKNGYQPNAITSGTLINGLCKIDATDSAVWILRQMEREKSEVDVVHYSTIINSFIRLKG
jgi:hypothetical protein